MGHQSVKSDTAVCSHRTVTHFSNTYLVDFKAYTVVTHMFDCQIFLHLPYHRRLEEEADEVGLQLMAKVSHLPMCISLISVI